MGSSGVSYGATDRWATPYYNAIAATSQTFTVGRALLAMFALPVPRTVDGIAYVVGGVSAGSVRAGIIGPTALAADTPQGALVAVESAAVAQGTINSYQLVPLTPTLLPAGLYYVGLQGSDATGTYQRITNQPQAPALSFQYDRAGGFGAFTSPTPAVTETGTLIPGLRVRLA